MDFQNIYLDTWQLEQISQRYILSFWQEYQPGANAGGVLRV